MITNPYFFATWWRKPSIFQTLTIWPNITHSLKYQWSTTSSCNVKWIRKLVFVIIAQLTHLITYFAEIQDKNLSYWNFQYCDCMKPCNTWLSIVLIVVLGFSSILCLVVPWASVLLVVVPVPPGVLSSYAVHCCT